MDSRSRNALVALLLFIVLVVLGVMKGYWKVLGISLLGFSSFLIGGGIAVVHGRISELAKLWAYGISSGAMIVAAGVFLLPQAVKTSTRVGGLAIGLGLLFGYVVHIFEHELTEHSGYFPDSVVAQLSFHAILTGIVIGSMYQLFPGLSIALGAAVLLHKSPAGYMAGEGLTKKTYIALLFPATAVGIAALGIRSLPISVEGMYRPLLFGIGTGLFLHVGVDLLPECTGTQQGRVSCDRDDVRRHAIASLAVGAAPVILVAWLLF